MWTPRDKSTARYPIHGIELRHKVSVMPITSYVQVGLEDKGCTSVNPAGGCNLWSDFDNNDIAGIILQEPVRDPCIGLAR
jgi:hypothetical protein